MPRHSVHLDRVGGQPLAPLYSPRRASVVHSGRARGGLPSLRVRACYAALRMLDAARRHAEETRRHAEETRRTLGVRLSIRVGLSAGEVVVRTIRDDLHMNYTAMVTTVHLASRTEQLSEPGTATLTAATLALVAGYV